MKYWTIKIGLWLIVLSAYYPLSAQFVLPKGTAESDDLVRIKSAYSQAGVLSCKMTYQLFAPSATQATDSMVGNLTLLGRDYHFAIGHFEYLQQGNHLLYIDHQAHQMVVFSIAKNNIDPTNSGQLASLLDRDGVVAEIQNLGGKQRKLTFDAAQKGIENVEIWYNTDNYFIEKTRTVLPQNKAILQVKYGQISHQKKTFGYTISAFTVLKNKKYVPTEKFKNYKVRVVG